MLFRWRNTTVFSLVDAVLLRPFPYSEPDHLTLLWGSKSEVRRGISGPDLEDLITQNHVFDDAVPFVAPLTLSVDKEQSDVVVSAYVGPRVFALLGVRPILGRTFLASEDQSGRERVAVLSYGFWQSRFGGAGIAGRMITLNGESYAIAGVMPEGFFFPEQDIQLWIPLPRLWPGLEVRGRPMVAAVARLKRGVTLEQAQVEIDTINKRLASSYPDTNKDSEIGISLLYGFVVGKYYTALWTLLGAVGLALLIACANIANVLLARGVAREKELAIRAAIGASPRAIIRQMLIESLLLAILGGTLGVLLAAGGLRFMRGIGLTDIPRLQTASLNGAVLLFTLGVSILTGFLFGLAPAWKASSLNLTASLNQGGMASVQAGRPHLRELLVVVEIALAFILLVGTGLLVSSFVRLSRTNWGFQPDGLLLIDLKLPDSTPQFSSSSTGAVAATLQRHIEFTEEILNRLKRIPGVESVGMGYGVPIDWGTWTRTQIVIQGRPITGDLTVGAWSVSAGYFQTLGVPILKGREFSQQDSTVAPKTVVLGRDLADRLWPEQNPVGQRLDILQPNKTVLEKAGRQRWEDPAFLKDPWSWERDTREVIGVVGNMRMFGLDQGPESVLYEDYRQATGQDFFLPKFVVRTMYNPLKSLQEVKSQIRAVGSDVTVVKATTMTELLSQSVGGRGSNKLLLLVSTTLGALALLLATMGTFGAMSYSVNQRRHEIGVRMTLGAQRGDILRMLLGQGMGIALLGLLFGLAGALLGTKILSGYLYEMTPTDPATLAEAAALLTLVGLLACYLPARAAMKVNPAATLRNE